MSEEEEREEKKESQIEFTEPQLLEMQKYLEAKRQLLRGHPESKDYAAIWTLQQFIIKRLQDLAWIDYVAKKGIEVMRV